MHATRFTGASAPRRLIAGTVACVLLAAGGAATLASARSPKRAAGTCAPPYAANSAWNQPIGASPSTSPKSASYVAGMGQGGARLSSDPTQYTYPVYHVTNATPTQAIAPQGWFSDVIDGGRKLVNRRAGTARMPIPPNAAASAGSDAQIIVINDDTGDEWDASGFTPGRPLRSLNVGHYNTGWSGVPPNDANGSPWWLRGSGVPYLAGLVRPCEIAQGHIDHALAFAYPSPSPASVYPARKSDGSDRSGMPEGTRLRLNPSVSDATIRNGWRCRGACFTIAKALQRYGMYVIDGSGHPKLFMEDDRTAHWHGAVSSATPAPIPLAAFRALAPARSRAAG